MLIGNVFRYYHSLMGLKTAPAIKNYFHDLVHLIYPEQCIVCESELTSNERHVCSLCDGDLIETSFHLYTEASDFDKIFWGRVQIDSTFAMYRFQKKSAIQKLLFQLKYKHGASVGQVFGKRIGKRLLNNEKYRGIEILLPVPLHPKKQFIRGYNQSMALAQGISESTGISISESLLKRNTNNSSQTRKGRFQRWDNVDSVFSVSEKIKAYNHIAIIDDVVTTGSTIEALIQSIRKIHPEVKISVITLAIA